MVLAQAEKLDVLDDHHLVISHTERRPVQYVIDIQMIAAGQKLERLFKPFRRLPQAFPRRVFADQLDDFAHVTRDAPSVQCLAVIFLIQKNFFNWLGHERRPSGSSPEYSKLLFPVSWMRTRSSLACGKSF